MVAFVLWLYVFTNVSQKDDMTFYNIPVVMEGESVLNNERNLMVTGVSTNTVSLNLSGARSDLKKVNSGNITVKANLSGIYEPGERIALSYDISFPGDVPEGAFVVEHKSPSNIYVNVDYRRNKEVPVQVSYTGTRSEDYIYDTGNPVLDNASIMVVGPAAVADQIECALIEVDLTDRVESISESFRYTLCNADGEPVDAEQITTNVETVRLDMKIQRIKEVQLTADIRYGGGTTETNTTIEIEPKTIRLSGSEKALEELGDSYSLGIINLAELERPVNELPFTITLPEGVTNETGVSEAMVTIRFTGLKTREFLIDNIQSINVPQGMEAEIINANLSVKVRGPAELMDKLTEEDIIAVVDLSGAEVGTATYKAAIVFPEAFASVGAMKSTSVSVTVQSSGG